MARDKARQHLYNVRYYHEHKDQLAQKYAEWRRANRPHGRAIERRCREKTKRLVLTTYGPNGELRCSWDNCQVDDLDMLTLDHVKDNGAEHRRALQPQFSGKRPVVASLLYTLLKKNNFPPGYQTLCANHQIKKELMRRRQNRLE
jgi:hypothetical protein